MLGFAVCATVWAVVVELVATEGEVVLKVKLVTVILVPVLVDTVDLVAVEVVELTVVVVEVVAWGQEFVTGLFKMLPELLTLPPQALMMVPKS